MWHPIFLIEISDSTYESEVYLSLLLTTMKNKSDQSAFVDVHTDISLLLTTHEEWKRSERFLSHTHTLLLCIILATCG